MSHEIEHDGGGGILAKKGLWLGVGICIFIFVGFILPTPQSVITTVEKFGFANKMIEWEIAHNAAEAAHKTMMVLGIIPMAVIFFATEAIPIGLTGTAVGIVSFAGFTPEVFMSPWMGHLLDRYPGTTGHQYVFLLLSLFAVIGFVASLIFRRNAQTKAIG